MSLLVIPPERYSYISSEMPVEMVKEWGMEGVFISANKPYRSIEESFKQSGILDKITFIDCASKLAGEHPSAKNLILIQNPSDFAHITKNLVKVIEKMGDRKFLVFDSLTTLLIYSQHSHLTQFAHTLGIIMKAKKVTSFFLAVDQEDTRQVLTILASVADKYVHLGVDEQGQVIAIDEPSDHNQLMAPITKDIAIIENSIKEEHKPYNVFLCYKKSSGKDFADHLKAGLEEFGLHTFLDSEDIPRIVDGKTDWAKDRDRAIEECRFFILIMTPGFEKSSEVLKELNLVKNLKDKQFVYFRFRSMNRKIVIQLENGLLDIGKQEQVSFETKEEILRLALNILIKGKAS